MNWNMVTTAFDGNEEIQSQKNGSFRHDEKNVENRVVNLYPDVTYETFEGFGGAVTDAAGYVYSLMDAKQKKQLMDAYFTQDGMNYHLVRVHMDSCDFSTEPYEALSDPTDVNLDGFSFERTEKYIMPMLYDAQAAAGSALSLMLSPWSPPAFMKTNGKRQKGGKLKPEYQTLWAQYICRYIKEFQQRGFTVERLSLQNEPNAVQTWDSCLYTAENEKVFLKNALYPELKKQGLDNIEVYIWDHNKERLYERACGTIDQETDSMIAGLAFHWYSGDHFEAMDLVRSQYPGKKLILSESCLEYYKFSKDNLVPSTFVLMHEILGDLNHGMCAFHDWNLLLDEKGGPNYVENFCHAPYLFHTSKKELMPQCTRHCFHHLSHYITPGSVRIAHTAYTDKLELVSYKTPEGNLAVVFSNSGKETLPVVFRLNGLSAELSLPPQSVSSCLIAD